MNVPKVSILMLSYNHEKYILQALRSAVAQKTQFPIEIVIGDDLSLDNTRNIIKEFSSKLKDKNINFKFLFYKRKVGMMKNLRKALDCCSGEFIAILEGDDYWSFDCKIQEQVIFLENNEDCNICFHNVLKVSEDGLFPSQNMIRTDKKFFNQKEIITENIIPAVSVMFRKKSLGKFPSYFENLGYGDWFLHIMNTKDGKAGYIDKVWATYRIHRYGVTSSSLYKNEELIKNIQKNIDMYKYINTYTKSQYKKIIKNKISKLKKSIYLKNKNYLKYILSYILPDNEL